MSNKLKYSVIIPTYNRPKNLGTLLIALENQSLSLDRFSVTIVNDGGHNAEYKYFIDKHHRSINYIILQQNSGPANARNYGVQTSGGDILVFTDDDCVPHREWLTDIDVFFRNHPELDVIGGTVRPYVHGKVGPIENYLIQIGFLAEPLIINNKIVCMPTSNFAVKREIFNKIQGFDTRFKFPGGEDTDLLYRLRSAGAKIAYNRSWFTYHDHSSTFLQLLKRWYQYGYGVAQHVTYRAESLDYGLIFVTSPLALVISIPKIYKLASISTNAELKVKPHIFFKWYFRALTFFRDLAYQTGAMHALRNINRNQYQREV